MTYTITVYCHHDTWTVAVEDNGRLITSWTGDDLHKLLTRASLRLQTEDLGRRRGFTPEELAAKRAKIQAALELSQGRSQ